MPFPADAAYKVRMKMDAGLLPLERPAKMFAGFGSGQPCHACDTPIYREQVEYEFDAPDGTAVRLHLGCAGLWEAERRKRGSL